jgi:hypothetical protein
MLFLIVLHPASFKFVVIYAARDAWRPPRSGYRSCLETTGLTSPLAIQAWQFKRGTISRDRMVCDEATNIIIHLKR